MLSRVKKIGEQHCLVMTPETMEALQLSEGDLVEVIRFVSDAKHCTTEEVLRIFRETLPQHENAYRELAK